MSVSFNYTIKMSQTPKIASISRQLDTCKISSGPLERRTVDHESRNDMDCAVVPDPGRGVETQSPSWGSRRYGFLRPPSSLNVGQAQTHGKYSVPQSEQRLVQCLRVYKYQTVISTLILDIPAGPAPQIYNWQLVYLKLLHCSIRT